MEEKTVRYIFELKDREVAFDVATVPQAVDARTEPPQQPAWAALGFRQCGCCPLKEADCKYCPVATRIHGLTEAFSDNTSTERVKVTVKTAERNYYEDCDLQVGINSMMGLLMATSGCPVLKPLGAMASFHIPFCSTRETLHRTVGSYLMKQYFVQLKGEGPDWQLKHLKELYDVLEGLNRDFSKRIRESIRSDAVSNAVIMFFATSVVVASSLERQLQQYEQYLTAND
jgi:hypothetical protein